MKTDSRPEWLLAALLVGTGLRCFRVGQNSLWIDEYASLATARAQLAAMPAAALADHALNPPIYFWLLHLIVGRFGENEVSLRLPSVVAGTLTIPLVWLLAREVSRSTWVANLSAILLAAHPLHLWYSQEARPYALLVLFSSAALWSLAVAIRTRNLWWWMGFILWGVLAALTQVIGFTLLFVGALWILPRARDRRLIGQYAAAVFTFVLLTLPFLFMLAEAVTRVHGTGSPPRAFTAIELPYTIYTYFAGYSLGPSLRDLQDLGWRAAVFQHPIAITLVSLIAAAVGWAVVRFHSATARDLAVLLVSSLLVAVALSLATGKAYSVRYTLLALIGFIPLIGVALEQFRPMVRQVGAVVLLGTFLWADVQWFVVPEYRKDDSRAAVTCLSQNLPRGATVAVAPAYMATMLAYYANRQRASLHVVGVDQVNELLRVREPKSLLLTRLHHVPEADGLLRGFAAVSTPALAGEVPGYHIYVAGATPKAPRNFCDTGAAQDHHRGGGSFRP